MPLSMATDDLSETEGMKDNEASEALRRGQPSDGGTPDRTLAQSRAGTDESAPAGAAAYSRFVQRVRRAQADELPLLPEGPPTRLSIECAIEALRARGRSLPAALRRARQLVLERLAVLDVEAQAPLDVVTRAMTELAEVTLGQALAEARSELDARHGEPRDASGGCIAFWIVGMGKLGACELNVSSDIDLVYVYESDGETMGRPDGGGVISAHEYFDQVSRRLRMLIGDVTQDGFVFRLDLALRPNGNAGPAVVSLSMLEEYFLVQGREWERFAWLKSRVVAPLQPDATVAGGGAAALREVVVPFV
jgi:glutamate-ammonia-ligase adenylyltransferase